MSPAFLKLKDKINLLTSPSISQGGRRSTDRLTKRKFCYLIYGVVVYLIVFGGSYLGSNIAPMIRAELKKQSQYTIKIKTISLNFIPPYLNFKGVDVLDRLTNQQLFKIDDLTIRLKLLSLVESKLSLGFESRAYGARVRGSVDSGYLFTFKNFIADFVCQNISLAAIPAVAKLGLGLKGSGRLDLSLKGTGTDFSSYSGQLHFGVQRPSFDGIPPLFKISKVRLDSLNGKASFENMVFHLEKLRLKGKRLSAELTGNIVVDSENICKSKLDLKGKVKADLKLFNQKVIVQKKAIALMKAQRAVPVKISESLGRPWVSLAK